jgi:hypothetical protein
VSISPERLPFLKRIAGAGLLAFIVTFVLWLGAHADDLHTRDRNDDHPHTRDRGGDGGDHEGGGGIGITIDIGKLTGHKDGDDPFDTPVDKPPVIYGHDEPPYKLGILLERDPNWIPKADDVTEITAQLYKKAGTADWEPSLVPLLIKFELEKRSYEPGDCMNHGKGDDPDLWFDQDENPPLHCYGKQASGALTKRPVTSCSAWVSCGDWGAYGRIGAYSYGCVHLKKVGNKIIEVTAEQAILTLPKDDNNNQIADHYEDMQGQHPNATDDKDDYPNGNGTNGDGLSAYEEYRGFMVNGSHIRTSWNMKDLFVYNEPKVVLPYFEIASGLVVHFINADEMDSNRVINFNHNRGYLGPQHGLHIAVDTLASGVGGNSPFGPPKNVPRVTLSAGHYDGHTADHEMGHAVGMHHHGDRAWINGNFYTTTTVYPPTIGSRVKSFFGLGDGKIFGPGPQLCDKDLPADFIIETQKGIQTSGDDLCIMRYHYGPDTVYFVNGSWECVGNDPGNRFIFCDSPAGTGINANGHAAGDATVGNCLGQMIVNDNAQ